MKRYAQTPTFYIDMVVTIDDKATDQFYLVDKQTEHIASDGFHTAGDALDEAWQREEKAKES